MFQFPPKEVDPGESYTVVLRHFQGLHVRDIWVSSFLIKFTDIDYFYILDF